MNVSEIEIIPIKPINGLVAFASCVIDKWLYVGSIGIYTRLEGGYRVTYPTKKVGVRSVNIFHPINSETGSYLENEIVNKYKDVTKQSNDRHNRASNRLS